MNKIFIGQFVSEEESLLDKRISQAGNNYQLKFIEMLKPELSISLYPIFLATKSKVNIDRNNCIMVNNQSSLPLPFNKYYRLIFDSIELTKIVRKSTFKNVFFYNMDKQNILPIILIKFLLKKNVFLVMADYSYFSNKTYFEKLANKLIIKVDGAIVLNSNIKINKNQQVLSGLLKSSQIKDNFSNSINNNVLLSGSLGVTTGLIIALETFSIRADYNLYITGRPYDFTEDEFNTLVNSYTSRCRNIVYLGLLQYNDYIEILEKCDIALSLRNPVDLEHQFNFPSKILEYLSKSKLVISSLKYKDLPENFLFFSNFDLESLGNTLDKIKELDKSVIIDLKKDIYSYLQEEFTEATLQKICNKLILNDK